MNEIKSIFTINKGLLFKVFLIMGILGLASHGYCFFNENPSHDSLFGLFQCDYSWQISLGRFAQPFYVLFRGNITSPTLIGFIALCFYSASAYLLIQMFYIKNSILIFLICGVMIVNSTVSIQNATYMPWVDMYAIALFLNILAIYCFSNFKNLLLKTIPSIIFIVVGLGLYQSYFQVSIILCFIIILIQLLGGTDLKKCLKASLEYVLLLLSSLLLYYFLFKSSLLITKIKAATTYNGLSQVGKYSLSSIYSSILSTYKNYFLWISSNDVFRPAIIAGLNYIVILFIVYSTFLLIKNNKLSKGSFLVCIILFILFPFSINFICFISMGMEHALMTYSFVFTYILAILLYNDCEKHNYYKQSISKLILYIPIIIIIFYGVVYSNQLYNLKELNEQSTLSTCTRIIDRVEQTDDYTPGKTPVAFIGTFDKMSINNIRKGYPYDAIGTLTNSAISYGSTLEAYFKEYLGYNINIVSVDDPTIIEKCKTYDLKSFPAKDSVINLDGTIIVKISD